MKLAAVSLRATAAAVALFAVSAAHADLTIPFAWTESNSVQTFTQDNLDSFDLVHLSVVAKGNASAKGEPVNGGSGSVNYQSYSFPITKIVIGSNLSIKSGQAAGSALYFDRTDDDTGLVYGLTLANFTIDYAAQKVLADITPKGGTTATQQHLYTFEVDTKLALKYKFPLTVTGHEVLKNLRLSQGAQDALNSALLLPEIAQDALKFDYGTLTQDVSTNLRKKSISSALYVAK
ncbi:hypothetical protein [Aquabacterium parvum]|uniref:hypothetical protein n=1 Tax=Aquabacterium parvum TaxID=70584 RepID=UPI000718F299|nr:hypothetical protein [Aquabacterium parvum]MBU0917106.1 hypothetical protein [Gammaproteobacteria bacterium]